MPDSASSPRFEDFDQPAIFSKYRKAFLNPDSLNFVLEFDHKNARAAFDLQEDDFRLAVHSQVGSAKAVDVTSPPWLHLYPFYTRLY